MKYRGKTLPDPFIDWEWRPVADFSVEEVDAAARADNLRAASRPLWAKMKPVHFSSGLSCVDVAWNSDGTPYKLKVARICEHPEAHLFPPKLRKFLTKEYRLRILMAADGVPANMYFAASDKLRRTGVIT